MCVRGCGRLDVVDLEAVQRGPDDDVAGEHAGEQSDE
jgi:hypothetical protein